MHVPCVLALRASSVYCASGVETGLGAEIPTPGPWPTPTPLPVPDPMPPPEPIPFDGGAEGSALIGFPKDGMWLSATRICGGATTVGSTANFGASFRTTIWGG